MSFMPRFWTTHIGSLPHIESGDICERLAQTLDVPAWPQFPRRNFHESGYVQFSASLPAVIVDNEKQKISFDTRGNQVTAFENFYGHYLADNVEAFALTPAYAEGFFAMLDVLRQTPGEWAKGHVTGPISFGLMVTDQDARPGLYNDLLADAILKNAAMNARWQIRQLRTVRSNVILFIDEPYMASVDSAFVSLTREQAANMINQVVEAIHAEGGLAGMHCCAATDWSVPLGTQLDIINLDAYDYIKSLARCPVEIRAFLDRGGAIAWGIVPNNKEIYDITPEGIAYRLHAGFKLVSEKAAERGIEILPEELANHTLITPCCGLGPTTVEIAELVLEVLVQTGKILK